MYNNIFTKKLFKVELVIEPGQSLGLMIRGGTEYNLGIFITGIDKESVADRSGLMVINKFHSIQTILFSFVLEIFIFRLVIKFWK